MSHDSQQSERDTTALVVMTAFFALIAGMLGGAWIYTDAINEKNAEIDKLQEENSAYADQVEQLEIEIEEKQQRLESLKSENKALGEDVDATSQEIRWLESEIETLETEKSQLEEEITDVRVNNGDTEIDHVAVAGCYEDGEVDVIHSVDEYVNIEYVSGENTAVIQVYDDRPLFRIDDLSSEDLSTEDVEYEDWMCGGER